jgi:hypothetical protein
MPANYILLNRIELNDSAASVTFSNIPQSGYTDLKVVMSVRTTRASTDDLINVNFNGVSTNQSSRWLQGNGTSASSGTYGSNLYLAWVDAASNTANTFGNAEMYIPNYTSANYKSISTDGVFENNATGAIAGLTAGLWSSIAAITSITLTSVFSANFVANSTFSLYGLAAVGTEPVIAPKATGGNLIENDGTYWIHTFNSTGTFTPLQGLSCDYLVVAGGGGGGGQQGGGGGAGGFRTSAGTSGGGASAESALSCQVGIGYTVTVGAGGAGGSDGGSRGTNGVDSIFSTVTSIGGGGGGGNLTATSAGASGGSGGGGRGGTGTSYLGGSGTANQGYAGGDNYVGGKYGSGAGGGAGSVGQNGSSTVSGNGGNGVATTITGTSQTLAGGGGGGYTADAAPRGTGTNGGGNGGNQDTAGSAGTANTGGGGGGAGFDNRAGGAGGSGIVVIRYPIA